MKKSIAALSLLFLLTLVGCDTATSSGNALSEGEFPTGKWFAKPESVDKYGYLINEYNCFDSQGKAHMVWHETDGEYYDAEWQQGTYVISGSSISIDYTDKVDYSGERDLKTFVGLESESMGDDEYGFTANYSVGTNTLTLSLGTMSEVLYLASSLPDYVQSVTCK